MIGGVSRTPIANSVASIGAPRQERRRQRVSAPPLAATSPRPLTRRVHGVCTSRGGATRRRTRACTTSGIRSPGIVTPVGLHGTTDMLRGWEYASTERHADGRVRRHRSGSYGRGPGLPGRHSRRRARCRGRRAGCRSNGDQRGDQRRAIDGDQRGWRIQPAEPRAGPVRHQGRDVGLQGREPERRADRHAAVPDAGHEARGRRPRGDGERHQRAGPDRALERVDRHGPRQGRHADAAVARPRRLPDRHHRADGDSLRRRPVQPPAGPDQRLAAVARRRHPPWQQLHARRRPDHGPPQPRHRQPEHRIARGHEGAGPHLRCRDGPHRRRRVQHDAAGRRQQPARHRLRADAPHLGPDQQLLQREGRARQAGQPVLPRRRRHRRAGAPQPHVLLVLDRELPRRPDAQRQRHDADRARTHRRLLADDQRRRRARGHLRSADRPAVRRQPDPGQPHEPDRGGDAAVPAARRRRARERLDELHAHVAHQERSAAALLGQGVAQVERHEHPHGLLSLQPDRRAGRQLLRHRRPVRADPVRRSG